MKERNLTLKEALTIVSRERSGKRDDLEKKVGKATFRKLCILGYITQGATVINTEEGYEREPVWKATDKILYFKSLNRELGKDDLQGGKAMTSMQA